MDVHGIVLTLVGMVAGLGLWAVKDFLLPDLLDLSKVRRAIAVRKEDKRLDYDREDRPIRVVVALGIEQRMVAVQPLLTNEIVSSSDWQRCHDSLYSYVNGNEAARALGPDTFLDLMRLLNAD